ncbi:hypothetical protein [Azospirillum argentinense]|uniref:class I SAM-dependent methyltransferase n=1 Tax=Azospirillum argentinense TaxID=2970906 RepID=UPI0032DFC798
MTSELARDSLSTWPEQKRAELLAYLYGLYKGVFTEEAIQFHLDVHVGFDFADHALSRILPTARPGERLFDIGSGFGSFVLAARAGGLDARGIEISEFETGIARWRLGRLRPQDDADFVFRTDDARSLDLPPASVDIVTLWNVLEHVDAYDTVLAAVHRLLRPGGRVFVICPNYCAWRLEAHYHVPWTPWLALLPRSAVARHIRDKGLDPCFFQTSIFRRTNWGVLSALKRLGFQLFNLDNNWPMDVGQGGFRTFRKRPRRFLNFWNPFRPTVELAARKI